MRREKDKFRPFKKLSFYCDEDFPQPSLSKFNDFKIKHSVLDYDYSGRDDHFHFQFATNQKMVLLTLDDDYLNNKKFKLHKTWGVILIKVGQSAHWGRVNQIVDKLMPLLKKFDDESLKYVKISASLEGYIKRSLKNGRIVWKEVAWRNTKNG